MIFHNIAVFLSNKCSLGEKDFSKTNNEKHSVPKCLVVVYVYCIQESKINYITFTFIHLADAFMQSDLQLPYPVCLRLHASRATRG